MQQFDPWKVLGVGRDATQEDIKAAFKKRAKETHPDTHPGLDADEFIRVQEAYDRLRDKLPGESGWSDGSDGSDHSDGSAGFAGAAFNAGPGAQSPADPMEIVRTMMADHDLEVDFRGNVIDKSALTMALTRADIERVLEHEAWSEGRLLDETMQFVKLSGIKKISEGDVKRAIRLIRGADTRNRFATVMKPLFKPLTDSEQAESHRQWEQFAWCFEDDEELVIAAFKHTIHQVMSKALGRHALIEDHLMVLIWNEMQRIGKTRCLLAIMKPLKELRTDPTLMREFVDTRAAELYKYPMILLDDVDHISPKQVPTLKALITGQGLTRRILGTGGIANLKLDCTLAGTANATIYDIVPDETGHGRFYMARFKNGNVLRGGDPKVWDIIENTDFTLLWRSVDPFEVSPIKAVLPKLFAAQEAGRPKHEVEAWLLQLDVNRPEVRAITAITPKGEIGVMAEPLYKLFRQDTGSKVTNTSFGTAMTKYTADPRSPLGAKERTDKGRVYLIR